MCRSRTEERQLLLQVAELASMSAVVVVVPLLQHLVVHKLAEGQPAGVEYFVKFKKTLTYK